jgi:aspartyl-tRNA(Asn)/glutamyl-tRNA(Gln) amidotransferase subunit C
MEPTPNTDAIDVRYVAHLARMHLTDAEAERFQAQLGHVLGYIDQLRELDVDGIEPTAHPRPACNVFREDTPGTTQPIDATAANAPRTREGLIIVPRIME